MKLGYGKKIFAPDPSDDLDFEDEDGDELEEDEDDFVRETLVKRCVKPLIALIFKLVPIISFNFSLEKATKFPGEKKDVLLAMALNRVDTCPH